MVATNARPIQQLIAFEKVPFAANERKTVRFTVNEQMLRFWNNENRFISEAGEFWLFVGYADCMKLTERFWLQEEQTV